ncbi:hypothetical protein F0P96_13905 [Hymenobacter busanensis]|uniref:Uncharacterized protein n=1 Tax=Hymenobacter busanensis TaxID=2607656 RepID=A0A7L4ZYZ5_9BACT|nr:hypothetical protein [Hymenobacter busanensis]KAA9331338.1 hypothetical protein F0P96_13905 [Hymenobacter busanensis]QHJ08491.1 hypothetical protein GUY19_14830 [Hymenobacter busanensis]
MKNAPFWLGLALMGLASHSFAQTATDALRYSQLQFGGTARTLGIGGANAALGADLGSLSANPAGLGLFQRSEVSFSPGFGTNNTNTSSEGPKLADSRNSLHVASFGAAFTTRRPDSDNDDWRSSVIGIGLTRVNDFNQRFHYTNKVDDNRSLFQYLRESPASKSALEDEYGTNGDNISTLDGLAYAAYLTDVDETKQPGQAGYITTRTRKGLIDQNETVLTTGAQTQFDIAYGASYRDKLYLGGGLGIVGLRYREVKDYQEAENDPTTAFSKLALREESETTGNGLNLRLGAIFRPADWIRVGASIQSPTFYSLTDQYSSSLKADYNPGLNSGAITSGSAKTLPSEYQYRLTTPWRATGGVATILGKYAFVTADVEYVNYSQARFAEDANADAVAPDFSGTNQRVSDLYQSSVNLRVGAEGRFDIFRVRAGYARYGDPYVNSDFDRTQQFYTGGVGLRQKNTFFDLAGVYTKADRFYQPYTLNNDSQPRVQAQGSRFTTTFTVGLLF